MEKYYIYNFKSRSKMFRSQRMSYFEIIIPRELAWQSMNLLGRIGNVHVVPSSKSQRAFYKQLKRCQECIEKLVRLQQVLDTNDIHTHRIQRASSELEKLIEQWTDINHPEATVYQIGQVESKTDELWDRYNELSKSIDSFRAKLTLYQDRVILLKSLFKSLGKKFFNPTAIVQSEDQMGTVEQNDRSQFDCRCGIISREDETRLQRIVFRISRGNVFIKFEDIQQQLPKISKRRAVFMMIYPKSLKYLGAKLRTLAESFTSFNFQIPLTQKEFDSALTEAERKIQQFGSLLAINEQQKKVFLKKLVTQNSDNCPLTTIQYLKAFIIKEKVIYEQLNQLTQYSNFVQGFIYVASKDIQSIYSSISSIARPNQPSIQLIQRQTSSYPTLFNVNSFTCSAQQIVETYGVARYGQANPGLFTCMTFPFLFGVMFGDIGHGAILLAFGVLLCLKEQEWRILPYLKLFTPHRYMILLMGFFSLYCGFIYNEYLSINLNIFGSCYDLSQASQGQPIPRQTDCVYRFGLDPVWGVADNGMAFVNSLKMKISVIIGVVHMSVGLIAKALNAIHFKSAIDFFLEFLPELIFLLVLFGYMDALIIVKWSIDWGLYNPNAPSIITTMINFPLRLGKTTDCCGGQPMWGTPSDTSQNTIQFWLLITAIICAPWILLPKPLMIAYSVKQKKKQRDEELSRLISNRSSDSQSLKVLEQEQRNISLNQLIVHQLIETIEFVLGCISNTASYLRLWALSLAHSQLSEVFFEETVQNQIVLGYPRIPLMVINFGFLSLATFAVLICMDSMECFLHALRLHWVQFQNKFYKADGFAFIPFSVYASIRKELSS